MKHYRTFFALALAAPLSFLGAQTTMAALVYDITLTNLSNNVLTPAPFVVHNDQFDLFTAGEQASPEVEALAEGGAVGGILDLADKGKMDGHVLDFGVAVDGGPIAPMKSATVRVSVDADHQYLSFLSMLAFSNDAFIGWATGDGSIDIYGDGTPTFQEYIIGPDQVWDAGTEVNDELADAVPALGGMSGIDENGLLVLGHSGIVGTGDIPSERNFLGGPVAKITVAPVPEPTTMLLFGTGLAGLAAVGRRKRSREE